MQRLNILKFLFILVVSACPFLMLGQTHEFGGIMDVRYDHKIVQNFHLLLRTELRFNKNFTNFDRFKIGGDLNYSFWKKRFKIDSGTYYLLSHQTGKNGNYYENRYRIQGSLSYTATIRQFRISYRSRIQSTFYKKKHKAHPHNPKTYFRKRLQFDYDFLTKPVTIYASTECFLRIYKNYKVDKFRTIVGMNYKLNANRTWCIFFRADNPIQIENPANIYSIGILYRFKK